jgi:hypothetical protein
MEINLNADVVYVTASTIVKLNEYFTLQTENGTIDLKVDISADFKDIPQEYHEIMINVLTSKYLNKVSFGHNPFSKCNPPKIRKWYQFWKSKN